MHLGGTKDSDKRRPHAGVARPPGRGDVIAHWATRLRGDTLPGAERAGLRGPGRSPEGHEEGHGRDMYKLAFFPTPVGTPGGKPLRLTASVKIARARPDRFGRYPFFCLCVCPSASLSSQIWIQQPTGLREKRPSDFHLIHFARLPRGASRAQFSTK